MLSAGTGQNVTGFVTRGRGITVHLSTCPQLLALEPERRVPSNGTARQRDATPRSPHVCTATMGMLAEIGAVCKTTGINVTRMEAGQLEDNKARSSSRYPSLTSTSSRT